MNRKTLARDAVLAFGVVLAICGCGSSAGPSHADGAAGSSAGGSGGGTAGTGGLGGGAGGAGVDGGTGASGGSGVGGTSGAAGTGGVDGGSDATVDADGASGAGGVAGVDGRAGASGGSGVGGTSGAAGTGGVDGGSDATVGADGASGASGASGAGGAGGAGGVAGTGGVGGTGGTAGGNAGTGGAGGAAPASCFDAGLGATRPIVMPTVGQLVISELMPDPMAVMDNVGEWFEVHATSGVDLNGLQGGTTSLGTTPLVPISGACVHLASGGYGLLARSSVSVNNGMLPTVDGTFSFSLVQSNGTLLIGVQGIDLDVKTWASSAAGRSIVIDPTGVQCNAPASTGSYNGTDVGTPKAPNPACL